MVDGKLKNHLISIKICCLGVFGILITNPLSDFEKWKWRMQYGERKIEKISNFDPIWYVGVYDVAY